MPNAKKNKRTKEKEDSTTSLFSGIKLRKIRKSLNSIVIIIWDPRNNSIIASQRKLEVYNFSKMCSNLSQERKNGRKGHQGNGKV